MNKLLADRRWPWVAVALGVVLCLPSLTTGLSADDWIHQLLVERRGLPGMSSRPLDLFTFAANPAGNHALMDAGMFPWWTDPTTKLAFFRPVSALTHYLDAALWPRSIVGMHLQNLFWFALALAAVAWVYRRFLPPAVAGLAILLYAVDDAHGPAVGWVANRNAMVAMALSLPALVFHDRWRRDGWRPGKWLGPLALGVGLLAGESALATMAYLFAYVLFAEKGPRLQRLIALWPYAVVIGVWRVLYRLFDYGAASSSVYVDPAGDPIGFLRILPERAAALLASQFALPWSDFTPMYGYVSPRLASIMTAVAVATVLLIALGLVPLWRRSATARMFATGLLLATVPVCATFAADRLLFFVGVGAMAVVAQLLTSARGLERGLAALFVLVHVVLAPPLLYIRSRSMETVQAPLARAEQSLPRGPEIVDKTLILVDPPGDFLAGYVLLERAARGLPRPAHLRWLSSGTAALTITREDDRTLRVAPEGGFLANLSERMLRKEGAGMPAGTQVVLTGVTVEVTRADEHGRPFEARFHFDRSLEDPSLVWRAWGRAGYQPFVPPRPGTTITLPSKNFFASIFGPL